MDIMPKSPKTPSDILLGFSEKNHADKFWDTVLQMPESFRKKISLSDMREFYVKFTKNLKV